MHDGSKTVRLNAAFNPETYQFTLFKKLLLLWVILLLAAAAINCYWFVPDFSMTLVQTLAISTVAVLALICRRVVRPESYQRTIIIFSVISTVVLASVVITVPDPNILDVAAGLMLHNLALCLIMERRFVVRTGIATSLVYLLALTLRGLLSGGAAVEEWSLPDYITKALFPVFFFMTATVIMTTQISALHRALSRVNQLESILPTCSYCHRIRDPEGNWHTLERYIHNSTETKFSHGICPDCLPRAMAEPE